MWCFPGSSHFGGTGLCSGFFGGSSASSSASSPQIWPASRTAALCCLLWRKTVLSTALRCIMLRLVRRGHGGAARASGRRRCSPLGSPSRTHPFPFPQPRGSQFSPRPAPRRRLPIPPPPPPLYESRPRPRDAREAHLSPGGGTQREEQNGHFQAHHLSPQRKRRRTQGELTVTQLGCAPFSLFLLPLGRCSLAPTATHREAVAS